MTATDDLAVVAFSDALNDLTIDFVVSGSIAAVESVRVIRALRRLGARVRPYLTDGATQFITPLALAWAAAEETVTTFSGAATHLAVGDACVIAPASMNFLAKVAHGLGDDPATTLVQSYLGAKKPVVALPTMHDSLLHSPMTQKNLETLRPHLDFLPSRDEEGKAKSPEPALLADLVAHAINRKIGRMLPDICIALGTTRGYIDAVRYISNYSSGALGSRIAEEYFRQGGRTFNVIGPCPIHPTTGTHTKLVQTNEEMEQACQQAINQGANALVMAASILDFTPVQQIAGKVSSKNELQVSFKHTDKIISKLHPPSGIKIGFKLETQLSQDRAAEIANVYMPQYQLSLMILNSLEDVTETQHRAFIYNRNPRSQKIDGGGIVQGKQQVAQVIVNHVADCVAKGLVR